jgi:hypothetical protein
MVPDSLASPVYAAFPNGCSKEGPVVSYLRSLRALPAAAVMLISLVAAQPAAAWSPVSSSGAPGQWSIKDSQTQPSSRCIYKSFSTSTSAWTSLKTIKVWPPNVFGTSTASHARWRFQLRRYHHSQSGAYVWTSVGYTGWQTMPATPTSKAAFTPRTWNFAQSGKNQPFGEDYGVRVQIQWGNQSFTSVKGAVLIELDWYRYMPDNVIDHFPCPAVSAIT